MSEELHITRESKLKAYQGLLTQLASLVKDEKNIIANLANISSAIHMTFNYLWVGFYLVENHQLVLGPFQGPIASTKISKGTGVCGTSWKEECTIIVKNVNDFPGHISCNSTSVSEIVVPLFNRSNQIVGVLDIDSTNESEFDTTDKLYLEQVAQLISYFI